MDTFSASGIGEEAVPVVVADALLLFHGPRAQQVGVNGRLARKAEPAFDASNVRVVDLHPRRPGGHPLSFRTGHRVARLVLDAAAGTIRSSVLRIHFNFLKIPKIPNDKNMQICKIEDNFSGIC